MNDNISKLTKVIILRDQLITGDDNIVIEHHGNYERDDVFELIAEVIRNRMFKGKKSTEF